MSAPSSPTIATSASHDPVMSRAERLSAAEHRANQEAIIDAKRLARIHEEKQTFRRLIDPGIMRPNNRENAYTAINVQSCTSGQPSLAHV